MKFIAIAALAIVSAECPEGECWVTDAETMEGSCTAVVEGETMCDEMDKDMGEWEDEGSNALFASAAAVAVAATLMY